MTVCEYECTTTFRYLAMQSKEKKIQAIKPLASISSYRGKRKGPQAGFSNYAKSATVLTDVSSKRNSNIESGTHQTSTPTTYSLVDDVPSKSTLPPNVVQPLCPEEKILRKKHPATSKCWNIEKLAQRRIERPVECSVSNAPTKVTQLFVKRKRNVSETHEQCSGVQQGAKTDSPPPATRNHQQVAHERKKRKKLKTPAEANKKLASDIATGADKEHAVQCASEGPRTANTPVRSDITHSVHQQRTTNVENILAPNSSRLAGGASVLSGVALYKDKGKEEECETTSPQAKLTHLPVEATQPTQQPWHEDTEMEDLSETITQSINEQQPLVDYKGIYLITDTNVFLQHLSLIKMIINADTGADTYIVCVPWIVVQELDRIRNHKKESNKELSAAAFKAILYINRMLEMKNPKLRGQTIAEARNKAAMMPSDGFDTNDDHLLCCCLSLHQQGSRVILMTNDTNLRNKAIINGIESYGARTVEKNLKDILANVPIETPTGECSTLQQASIIIQQGVQAVWEKAKQILQHCFSVVLCMELKSALGDNWLQQIAIRPPWTVVSALECALKYWQDCHLLPSSALTSAIAPSVKKLAKMLKDTKQGVNIQLQEGKTLEEFLDHSVKVCSRLQLHYFHLADEVATLRKLKDGWKQNTTAMPSDAPVTSAVNGTQKQDQNGHPASGISHGFLRVGEDMDLQEPVPAAPASLHSSAQQSEEHARQCIQLLQDSWSLINDFCGTVSKQVSRCYAFPYQENRNYISNVSTLQTVYKYVYQTREHMDRLLKRQPRDPMLDVASLFLETLETLVHFLLEKLGQRKVSFHMASSQMALFFLDEKRRDLLDNGFKQIITFEDTLGHCVLDLTKQESTRKTRSSSSSCSTSSD